MKKLLATALATLAAVVLSACHNGGSDQNSTQMRVVNAVVDAEPLDFLIDGSVKAAAIPVGTVSSFQEFGSGTRNFQLRSSTTQAILVDKTIGFGSGAHYTLLAFGKRASVTTLQLTDETTTPSSGHFKARVVGLSPDVGPVDVYFAATTDISQTAPALGGIIFGSVTDYIEVTPGSYNVIFTIAGTKDVVFRTTATQSFTEGSAYTIGVFPSTGGKLANALILVNNGAATLLTNPLARVKGVNGIADSTPLNFKADGTTLLSGVPYTAASAYVTTTSGQHTLQVEAAAVPGSIIASASATLNSASDYTMLAMGTFAAPRLVVLADDNSAPTSGFAKIRFVNATTGVGNVDVLVDFASQVRGIAPGTASAYSTVAPKLDYTITFTTPGGVQQLATLSPVELDPGGVYSAYLFGSGSSVQAKLVRDR